MPRTPAVEDASKPNESFATLLQDANVDPLIRQITLGHAPTTGTGLSMTANYTHARRETQKEQIEQALRRWPNVLHYAADRVSRSGSGGVQGVRRPYPS